MKSGKILPLMKKIPHFSIRNTAFFIILTAIIVVNALRFFDLENVPQGFFVDEIGSAVNANDIATRGVDYSGRHWPLFGFPGWGTPKPPTQMYPLAAWIKMFGVSIGSIRAFSAFAYTVGLAGIFFLARLIGGSACGWMTLFAATLSPWAWMFSRIAFECILGPVFLIWGIFFFLRNARAWDSVLAGFCLACAMYSYPPMRLDVPLVILFLIGYQMAQKKIRPDFLGLFFISIILFSFPLIYLTLQGGVYTRRFYHLCITSQASSYKDLAIIFLKNYFSHFSFKFLFLSGDGNLRHSTGHFGELSWLDMLGLAASVWLAGSLFFKKQRPDHLMVFLLLAFAAGIVPAALTWQGIPHALRSIGSQPFMELLVGYALSRAVERWPWMWLAASGVGIIFAACFLMVYFRIYPVESAQAFNANIRMQAEHCQTEQDWKNFSSRYKRIIYQYYFMRSKLKADSPGRA